jgi:hypothetical protein
MGNQLANGNGVSGVSIVVPKGGGGVITVQDEGVTISNQVTTINFSGSEVIAMGGGNTVTVYIPPPNYDSHWNTSDGNNGNQAVTDSTSRTLARIASPDTEGTPFYTAGWAGTNQSATRSTSATFTTPSTTTGWGGNSYMVVTMYSADGSTVLETYTTPSITGNGVFSSPSGYISVTITSYGIDSTRFKAKASVLVQTASILSATGLQGGRYDCTCVMHTDTTTDGTGPYPYTQTSVFYDTNPTTSYISGTVTMAETAGNVVTKHLSGVEYYAQNTQFTATVTTIDQLNRNTAKTTGNLTINGGNYQLGILSQSPFGSGSTYFSNWTNNYDQNNVDYQKTDWAITSASARYRGTTASASAYPSDTWANGSTVTGPDASILIDTYGTTSSDLVEDFDDEARRQDSTWNTGNPAGNWNSVTTLSAGEAQVIGGLLIVPSQSTLTNGTPNANWTSYSPTVGGANPNYSTLLAPVDYYRTIVDTSGLDRSSFTMSFIGTFVVNATTDLASGDLEIFISRRASSNGGYAGYNNPYLLEMHGPDYNFASFDDGVTNGYIREASSSGNTVNCTFGGFSCNTGFFMHIKINNPAIKIDRLSVTFY